jgi:hypothetical protein
MTETQKRLAIELAAGIMSASAQAATSEFDRPIAGDIRYGMAWDPDRGAHGSRYDFRALYILHGKDWQLQAMLAGVRADDVNADGPYWYPVPAGER